MAQRSKKPPPTDALTDVAEPAEAAAAAVLKEEEATEPIPPPPAPLPPPPPRPTIDSVADFLPDGMVEESMVEEGGEEVKQVRAHCGSPRGGAHD